MNEDIKTMRKAVARYSELVLTDHDDGDDYDRATSEAVVCGRKITASAGGVLDYVDQLEAEIARLRDALEAISELPAGALGGAYTIAENALNAGKGKAG